MPGTVKIGTVSSFPPQPGQPYPPARNHPKWKEIYRLHDEWLMKYWPFSSEQKRARIPFMNLAGFSTWCAPAADFDRMVWAARLTGAFFLADDYVDTGKMLDRIPGFKQAATGNGPLHPGDRAEICHDIIFRAIKATCHPRTFDQLTKCTHEWWDSNGEHDFVNLNDYLSIRRVNIAMYFSHAFIRYTLEINLTDEQINHPLMREAEGVVSDHVGLVNDLFSYAKERLTGSDDTNILRLLQERGRLSYEEAKRVVENKIRECEQAYIPAGLAVLNHPELGKDPEVHRWISSMPYCMGGNIAWSQQTGRYNIGDVGGIPFPQLAYAAEDTPMDETVDDVTESQLRQLVFNVEEIPQPDLSLDTDLIESPAECCSRSLLPPPWSLRNVFKPSIPRPRDVGIVAIDIYNSESDDFMANPESSSHTLALAAIKSLLHTYAPVSIGRVELITEASAPCIWFQGALTELLGTLDLDIFDQKSGPATALFSATNWIEGSLWDGRSAIIVSVDNSDEKPVAVAALIGPMAPIVLEPVRGMAHDQNSSAVMFHDCYSNFFERLCTALHQEGVGCAGGNPGSIEFDYMIYDSPLGELSLPVAEHLIPAFKPQQGDKRAKGCVYEKLAAIIGRVPGYNLFGKRIAIYAQDSDTRNILFVMRIKGDTKHIWENLNLNGARGTLVGVACRSLHSGGPLRRV